MIQYKRNINNDFLNLFSILKNLYNRTNPERGKFDSGEIFYIQFNNGEELFIENMTEIISEDIIMQKYTQSGLSNVYGNEFDDIFSNAKFTAHTHPIYNNDNYKRPSDGDYVILKESSFNTPHYTIDDTYIYCINFLKDSVNGFYGKWNINEIYISDEHFDIEKMKFKFEGNKPDESQLISGSGMKESSSLVIKNDGTIRIESNI